MAGAQSAPPTPHSSEGPPNVALYPFLTSRCLDSIPLDRMQRVPVYLTAKTADTDAKALRTSADLMAQDVAAEVRRILGAAPTTLPSGDPGLNWRSIPPDLVVTIHRHGPMTRRHEVPTGSPPDTSILTTAFDDVVRAGGAILWPDESTADSLMVTLRLEASVVAGDNRISPPIVAVGFPAFTVPHPTETPARFRSGPTPWYPEYNLSRGIEGTVILQFVIDTAGRPVPDTVRELWPANLPRFTGERGQFYRAFIESARGSVAGSQFTPARIDRCVVPQLLQQPYLYRQVR
ncbi:MAG: hypothetical protein NVS1B4_25590 [Gemmatimonadaceae bacterium]